MFVKRGQVTIFVIVAVIIVAVVGGYFVLRSDGIGGDVDLPSTPEGVEFKVYMDECLEDVLEEKIYALGFSGGYHSIGEEDFVGFNRSDDLLTVPYYLGIGGDALLPTRESLENQLAESISSDLVNRCSDENFDFEVNFGEIEDVEVIFAEETSVVIKLDVQLSKGETVSSLSEFSATVPFNFNEIHELTTEILELQKADQYHVCVDCLDSLRTSEIIFIDAFSWQDNTLVFVLTNQNFRFEGEPYKFYFAIKYPEYDCANLPSDIDDYIKEECENA